MRVVKSPKVCNPYLITMSLISRRKKVFGTHLSLFCVQTAHRQIVITRSAKTILQAFFILREWLFASKLYYCQIWWEPKTPMIVIIICDDRREQHSFFVICDCRLLRAIHVFHFNNVRHFDTGFKMKLLISNLLS